eukprot:TRINITY_DN51_c2_g1_i2.p1 TRINITY_DN51_c2_g1~~TRINITY_DN51_c2_g1_i2.p1  ORF type:complete len:829 (-),score=175.86 TRINITY_DN51_c2_g1_i2:96-2582(-)
MENEGGSKKRKRSPEPPSLGSSVLWSLQTEHTVIFSNDSVASIKHENDITYNKILLFIRSSKKINEKQDLYLKITCNMNNKSQLIKGTKRKHPSGEQCFIPLSNFAQVTSTNKNRSQNESSFIAEMRGPMWILETVMKQNETEKVSGRSLLNLLLLGQYKLHLAVKTGEGEYVEDKEPLENYWRSNDRSAKRRKIESEGDKAERSRETTPEDRSSPLTTPEEQQQAGSEFIEKETPLYIPALSPYLLNAYDLYQHNYESMNNDDINQEEFNIGENNLPENDLPTGSSSTPPNAGDDFSQQKDYSAGYQYGYSYVTGTACSQDILSYQTRMRGSLSNAYIQGNDEGLNLDRDGEGDKVNDVSRNAGKNMGFVAADLTRVAEPDINSGAKYSELFRIGYRVGFWQKKDKASGVNTGTSGNRGWGTGGNNSNNNNNNYFGGSNNYSFGGGSNNRGNNNNNSNNNNNYQGNTPQGWYNNGGFNFKTHYGMKVDVTETKEKLTETDKISFVVFSRQDMEIEDIILKIKSSGGKRKTVEVSKYAEGIDIYKCTLGQTGEEYFYVYIRGVAEKERILTGEGMKGEEMKEWQIGVKEVEGKDAKQKGRRSRVKYCQKREIEIEERQEEATTFWDYWTKIARIPGDRVSYSQFIVLTYDYCNLELPLQYHLDRVEKYDKGGVININPRNDAERKYESLWQMYRVHREKVEKTTGVMNKDRWVALATTFCGRDMIERMFHFLGNSGRSYHGKIQDEETKERMRVMLEGSFLVRDSLRLPGKLTVSYKKKGKVKNERVTTKEGGYYEYDGKEYKSINELVAGSKLRKVCLHPIPGNYMH